MGLINTLKKYINKRIDIKEKEDLELIQSGKVLVLKASKIILENKAVI